MVGLANQKPQQPSEQQPQTKDSLLLDGLRRLEEHSPVWALPRLVTTLNLHRHLAAARQRLCDSHQATMKDAGADVQNCDDGGGIGVNGDTTTTINGLRALPVVLGMLAAMGLGAGGTALAAYLLKPTNQPVTTSQSDTANWRLGIKVSNSP